MTEAGSQAPVHGCLRASDADREQAIDSLKAAFVRGRLDKNEFDLRIGLALAAQARADLAAVTADIPAEVAGTSLPPERARLRRDPPAKTGAAVVVVAVDAGAFAAAVSLPATLIVVFLVMLAVGITGTALVAALIRGMLLIEARHARRPDGQMPPPGAAGSRSRRMLPATVPGGPPLAGSGPRHTAEAASGSHPRPRLLSPPLAQPRLLPPVRQRRCGAGRGT